MSQKINIVGIGMGNPDTMTVQAAKAVREADALIGAKRMLEPFSHLGKPSFCSYRPEEIVQWISEHPQYPQTAVLLSGDTGFYSGAKRLVQQLAQQLPKAQVQQLPGISSLSYFCARLMLSWEDVRCVSLHGRNCQWLGEVSRFPKVFFLTGGGVSPNELAQELCRAGLGEAVVHVGESLSYPNEKITSAPACQMVHQEFDPLSVVLVENPRAFGTADVGAGLPDEAFIRGESQKGRIIPMTKSEVRAAVLSKLAVRPEDIVYDIGAGTGSVSIEAALAACSGRVYAVERDADAVELIRRNREKFGLAHLEVVEGEAPQALEGLPAPDCAFVGGSSGSLPEIFRLLLQKNPQVRIVVSAVSLEGLTDGLNSFSQQGMQPQVVQLSVAKARQMGGYRMMMGQNPVYLLWAGGKHHDQ